MKPEIAPIHEATPDGVKILLMRRTGNDTVKTSVGSVWPGGVIRGWYGSRPPTHFCSIPPYPRKEKTK